MAAVKRELAVPQSSFRVKDLVGAAAKSRGEWWIDAAAATAWLQPADVVVLPCPSRIYVRTHPHTPIRPIAIPIPTIDLLISIAIYVHPPFTFHSFTFGLLGHPRRALHPLHRLRLPPLPHAPPNPRHRSPLGALIRLRGGTGCTYENVTHIST